MIDFIETVLRVAMIGTLGFLAWLALDIVIVSLWAGVCTLARLGRR
jgi:hypothetical protein